MTEEKFFPCIDKESDVMAIRVKWNKNKCEIEEILDFSRKQDVDYRFIEKFGTGKSTDWIITTVEDSSKMIDFLKKNGLYLSHQRICNNAGKLLKRKK